jgi:hypothetical protein
MHRNALCDPQIPPDAKIQFQRYVFRRAFYQICTGPTRAWKIVCWHFMPPTHRNALWWGHHFYGYNLAYSLELELDLFSNCRKAPTCNSCHGFIWIPIWVFYYSMESSSSLLWDGSSLMCIPYQSRSQSLILYRDIFCQWWICSYMLLLMILRIDCYLIMLWWLGTMEEIRKGLKRDVEVPRSIKGGQAKLESQSMSSRNPIRISGTVRTKIVTQITYQLHFWRSLYGWKDKKINILMERVSYPNTLWVHGERRNNEAHIICHGVVLPYLGPVGFLSSWAQ